MLEPWIIEEIRRREDERNRERDARLELPLHEERWSDDTPLQKERKDEQPSRGVVVIDL